MLDGLDGGLESRPMRVGPQAVDATAMRAIEATEKNGFGKAGEIGGDKSMPPERFVAMGAAGRLGPKKFFTQNS